MRRKSLNTMYGPDLLVELDSHSYHEVNFLDYTVKFTDTIVVGHYNKNFEISEEKRIVRYPRIEAEYPKVIYFSTLVGALIKTFRNSSTFELKTEGIFKT